MEHATFKHSIINEVVIVGGGTAGWLTAARLAKELGSLDGDGVKVTLIESPDIPTVGVGEGTWPTIRKTLASLDIDETEFMRQASASFKQGTQFVDWQRSPQTEQDQTQYYHLFSTVCDSAEFNLSPYWQLLKEGSSSYAEMISAQYQVCERQLAPKTLTHAAYEGAVNYAYHLDAGKFADLLKSHCIEKLGVKFISDNVLKVHQAEDGSILELVTENHNVIAGDLFVDCSGFRSLLLGDTLGIGFKKINDTLFTDSAVAIQVPYASQKQAISSVTRSTAQQAGWIWDIGLPHRRGVGHVYCSDFIDPDQAELQLRQYIKKSGGDASQLNARHIKMNCGYREKFWHKNCVAIGLSAAFVEPLEASAIFLIEAATNMLCAQFPRQRSQLPAAERKFNESFHFRWQRTIDFIKMHYVLSKRQEPFWVANRDSKSIPDSLKEMLESWRFQAVSRYDFPHVFEPFPQDSYQFVLHGMAFEQDLSHNRSAFSKTKQASQLFSQVEKQALFLVENLPSNRDITDKLKQYAFQKI